MAYWMFTNNVQKPSKLVLGRHFTWGVPAIVMDRLIIQACQALGFPGVVCGGPTPAPPSTSNAIELESGLGRIALEDGSGVILLETA